MKPAHMGSKSVISIAALVEDEAIRETLILSDFIRNETLNRLCSMPGYKYKSLKWKNVYYAYWKKTVSEDIKKGVLKV